MFVNFTQQKEKQTEIRMAIKKAQKEKTIRGRRIEEELKKRKKKKTRN